MIVFGGVTSETEQGFGYPQDPILIFNLFTFQYEAQIEWIKDKISPRHSHTACFFPPDKIIIYGGSIKKDTLHEILILTIKLHPSQTITRKSVKQGSKMKRKHHFAQVYKNSMFIFGGVEQEDGEPFNDLWELDLGILYF